MKKIYFFLTALVVIIAQSWAYDFSYTYQGQTLYYNIVDGNAQVTYQNTPSYSNNYTPYTNLTGSLTIPSSVTYNGSTYSVTSIGESAFYNCDGLTSVTIPNSVISIGRSTFMYCDGLTSVTIGNSIISIGWCAFEGCSGLTSVYYTGDVAGWCGIEFNSLPSNPLYFAHNLYINNTLVTNLVVPNSVTEINSWAFKGATCLTSVNIGNSVTSIGSQAFEGCSGLTFVTIGNSVTSIGESAFAGCSGLTEIQSLANMAPTLGENAFNGVNSSTPVYVPCGREAHYYGNWSYFSNIIEGSAASFSAVSNDNSMGTVQILTMPTCTNPQAVVYAVANSGYQFDHWSDNSTSNPYVLTVNEDMELTAYFSPVVTYYTITVTSDDDEMGIVSGGGSFTENTTTTITATANSGYHFVQWQDGNTEASRSITVTADATYTAYFAANSINYYTITVTSDDDEMGTVSGSGSFAENTTTTITATANSGYHFVQWQDGNTESSRSITVTADAEYTAYFAANDYTITVMAQNPSMGSTTGSGTFAYGIVTTITAEPYEGYYFVQWNDGNTQRIRTITVTGNATYTAYFDRSNGIDDITADQIKIYSRGSEIVIEGADNGDVLVYDVMGRIVHRGRIESSIRVNNTGVYMVKIGDSQPQKVVVR